MEDNFKLYKKWFWIGIIIGFFNVVAGIVYGIALASEREHRKEGVIILVWSAVIYAILLYQYGNLQPDFSLPSLPGQ
ncbi:MAG: hypothetical protein Q8Q37_02870 [bacterium]|nr:hypothetical protein [bacterium]